MGLLDGVLSPKGTDVRQDAPQLELAGQVPSPLGDLVVYLIDRQLAELRIEPHRADLLSGPLRVDPVFAAIRDQLERYFQGELQTFDLPLAPAGIAFDRKVWAAVQKIPFGQTASYSEIAARIGHPGAARAVGNSNARNPLMVVIPCHRVISAAGRLAGTGAGRKWRRLLLEHEGVTVNGDKVSRPHPGS